MYDPEKYIPIIDAMGNDGEGMAEAIIALGISRDTFYRWQKEFPEFSDAIKEFRDRSEAWWSKQGRLSTFGATPGFSATSYIFNMKNRFPDTWKDKQEVEHDVSDPMQKLFAEIASGSGRIGVK